MSLQSERMKLDVLLNKLHELPSGSLRDTVESAVGQDPELENPLKMYDTQKLKDPGGPDPHPALSPA